MITGLQYKKQWWETIPGNERPTVLTHVLGKTPTWLGNGKTFMDSK